MTQEQQVIEMMRVGLFYAPACVAMQRAAFFRVGFPDVILPHNALIINM